MLPYVQAPLKRMLLAPAVAKPFRVKLVLDHPLTRQYLLPVHTIRFELSVFAYELDL